MEHVGLIFFLLFALPIAIFIHEFGHALFAKSAGLRVLALVIGTGQPIFVRRVRGTLFVVMSRPWLAGMAICVSETFRTTPRALAMLAIGGPLSSLIAGVLLLPAVQLSHSEWLAFFSVLSILLGLTNAFPFRARVGPVVLKSDGMLALGALRGTNERDTMLGQSLASSIFVRDLFRKLGDKEGEAHLTSMVALSQISIADFNGAAETLGAECLDGSYARAQELIARAALIAAIEPSMASEVLAYARSELAADFEALVVLAFAEADAAVARKDPQAEARVLEAFRLAQQSAFPQMITAVELCAMRARPSDDPWATGQKIMSHGGARQPSLHLSFEIWGTIAEQLEARGDHVRAVAAVREADVRLRRIASGIGDARAREIFFAAKSASLVKIAPIAALEAPLPPTGYRRFANGCALAALVAYVLFAIVVMRFDGRAFELFVSAVVFSLLGLSLALIGTIHAETRRSVRMPLLLNAALAAVPFFLAALGRE